MFIGVIALIQAYLLPQIIPFASAPAADSLQTGQSGGGVYILILTVLDLLALGAATRRVDDNAEKE
jgi:hypothetical protein